MLASLNWVSQQPVLRWAAALAAPLVVLLVLVVVVLAVMEEPPSPLLQDTQRLLRHVAPGVPLLVPLLLHVWQPLPQERGRAPPLQLLLLLLC